MKQKGMIPLLPKAAEELFSPILSDEKESPPRTAEDQAVINLMSAVFLAALEDLNSGDIRLASRAINWLYDTRNSEYLFSFQSICKHLNLDPDSVLDRLDGI